MEALYVHECSLVGSLAYLFPLVCGNDSKGQDTSLHGDELRMCGHSHAQGCRRGVVHIHMRADRLNPGGQEAPDCIHRCGFHQADHDRRGQYLYRPAAHVRCSVRLGDGQVCLSLWHLW